MRMHLLHTGPANMGAALDRAMRDHAPYIMVFKSRKKRTEHVWPGRCRELAMRNE